MIQILAQVPCVMGAERTSVNMHIVHTLTTVVLTSLYKSTVKGMLKDVEKWRVARLSFRRKSEHAFMQLTFMQSHKHGHGVDKRDNFSWWVCFPLSRWTGFTQDNLFDWVRVRWGFKTSLEINFKRSVSVEVRLTVYESVIGVQCSTEWELS